MRLGEAAGLGADDLSEVYHTSLLRYLGCNAEVHAMAAMFGDEFAFRRDFALIDTGRVSEVGALIFQYLRRANAGAGAMAMTAAIAHGLLVSPKFSAEGFAGHC